MKKILLFAILVQSLNLVGQENYYFDNNTRFDTDILSPSQFMGYDIGDHHTRYDKIVEYMRYLAESSNRLTFEIFGMSIEKRPQIILTITSPENHGMLEDIRRQHLKLSDPLSNEDPDLSVPLIIQLGFNVHGNEASGGEASLLAAYYLAAARGNEIDNILTKSVIFIEPVLNPDGRARFVTWVNMNRSKNASPDGNDREHTEDWPGGRTNHYWYDLNRDWLPLTQSESKNRMLRFHKWKPNIVTDHHEMGTNSTFFFEPTKPGSENPIVPAENYTILNTLFAEGYSDVLDKAGHYYDSGRSFDNSYPGYGSSYADINGGLALLFEQASTRGLIQENDLGYKMHYSLGIKNQFFCALSTVKTAVANPEMLNEYMAGFFRDALKEAENDSFRGYVFGESKDHGRTFDFADMLTMHDIKVLPLTQDITVSGRRFPAGSSFVVPTEQAQYKMVRTMFEANKEFPDSLFYDATAWALVYSYGLPFAGLTKLPLTGDQIDTIKPDPVKLVKSTYGYIFDWSDYYSPMALNKLMDKGIKIKAAWEPVTISTGNKLHSFGRGSVFIPVAYQDFDPLEIFTVLSGISEKTGINIYPVESSKVQDGPWIGNNLFRSLHRSKVLMLTGAGISSSSAGTIWDLLDTRLGLTFTKIDISRFSRINLYDYNTIILPSGNYSDLSEIEGAKISRWVNEGGNLVSLGRSMSYLKGLKMISYESKNLEEENRRINYDISRLESGKHSIGGVFCRVDLDITNPLAFGYNNRDITVYKNNRSFIKMPGASTANVAIYKDDPIISGYVSDENLELFKGCASVMNFRSGRGNITVFVDDPVFRGCWRGTDKLLINAIFFGPEM